VAIGDFSRGGRTRGDAQAGDHDLGCPEKYIPWGLVDEDTGQLSLPFGSSYQTSDFMVDALQARWATVPALEQARPEQRQLKMDNGPESSGVRPQFLHRLVQFADQMGKPIQLLYYPPYHSKSTPLDRWWGIWELHWHGTKLLEGEPMLAWAKSMTWKGLQPVVELSRKAYQRGMALGTKAMQAVASRLERHPALPKWDILIRPASPA
jgi:Rhodopirellula transposase DDE domain